MNKASIYASKAAFEKEFLPENMPRFTRGWWDEEDGTFYYHDEFLQGAFVCFQRLEARMKELEGRVTAHIVDRKRASEDKARLEAELARLGAQEPVGEVAMMDYATTRDNGLVWITLSVKAEKANSISLNDKMFSAAPHPAHAADLTDLVPLMRDLESERQNGFLDQAIGWNDCRAAILRKIEGAEESTAG